LNIFFAFLQDESRILRVKIIAGIGLAKKDILGARSVHRVVVSHCTTLDHFNGHIKIMLILHIKIRSF